MRTQGQKQRDGRQGFDHRVGLLALRTTGKRRIGHAAFVMRALRETLFIGQTYIDVDLSARYGDPALHFVAS